MKIKSLGLSIIWTFLASSILAQSGAVMVKSAETEKWGYIDLSGKEIIPAQYKSADPFSTNGIAHVREGDKDVFIDRKGKAIKLAKFKKSKGTFHDGLLAVANDKKKWGFMNSEGEMVIPFQFSSITKFNGGYATAEKDDHWYVIDTEGNLSKYKGELRELKKFSEGLAPVYSKDKKNGFVDGTAKLVIPAKFKTVGYFSDGLAWAKNSEGKAGYIDKTGTWVIKPKYQAVGNFDAASGLARVKLNDQWQYVDKAGAKFKAPRNTDHYGKFKSGLAVGRVDGKFGYYDHNMEWVIKPQYDKSKDFKGDYAIAKKDDKWGVIDKSGAWVIKPIYIGIKNPVVFE